MEMRLPLAIVVFESASLSTTLPYSCGWLFGAPNSGLSSYKCNNPDVNRHPDCCVNIYNSFFTAPSCLNSYANFLTFP